MAEPANRRWVYRHTLATRLFHWITVLALAVLVPSGFQIFEDAVHPQTILAYEMNDRPLLVAHGAPLRLRVERQLGYKMAKYVMAVELVESFARIEGGRGGYWEDRGYEWYAGS